MDYLADALLVGAGATGFAAAHARKIVRRFSGHQCIAIGANNEIGWYCEHGKHVHKYLSSGVCFCGKKGSNG